MTNEVTREAPRVIQGVILKCVDGRWEDRDGLPPPDTLMAIGTARCLQRWKDQQPVHDRRDAGRALARRRRA